MKISIDGRGINWYHGTGIGTYTDNLIQGLLSIDKTNEYLLYWAGENYDNFRKPNCSVVMASNRHHKFFEDVYFPQNNKSNNIDLHHIPQNGIGLNSLMSSKKIVTIHDLIPYIMPETVGRGYLIKFLQEMPKIIKEAASIITVSNWSKNEILRFFPNAENKIFVTHLAAKTIFKPLNKVFCKDVLKSKFNIENDFILYIGGFSPRKNVTALLRAFSKIHNSLPSEYKLVITGSIKGEGSTLPEICEKLKIRNKVIFAGFVDESKLPIFYNAASLFVYPSLYEGFGLPPLEALNCGTPVIASNVTSIPEVLGDAAILINPLDEETLATEITAVLSNPEKALALSTAGLDKAKEYTWTQTAENTLSVYKSTYEHL
ncbi:glycosyltransferase family 4 protein [Clostridium cellulovorans]|uniref:Glycosyl transferase group 1 n=2 Tax=Clostridium cellulovorans TaxID=1493 RepID=D9SUA3_CLOC7|nr:glycosyltransferase family 1 protein [Clostridium cellulovorans]ADL52858.1 glycosyl transferase group 1 [Clostridium cellulovorans 743B]BAV13149.1 glycosyltransferase [Clostridium cellulovorans]